MNERTHTQTQNPYTFTQRTYVCMHGIGCQRETTNIQQCSSQTIYTQHNSTSSSTDQHQHTNRERAKRYKPKVRRKHCASILFFRGLRLIIVIRINLWFWKKWENCSFLCLTRKKIKTNKSENIWKPENQSKFDSFDFAVLVNRSCDLVIFFLFDFGQIVVLLDRSSWTLDLLCSKWAIATKIGKYHHL